MTRTAELIDLKQELLRLEREMRVLMEPISKRKKIEFERTKDFGERGFSLTIYFDEFNPEHLDGLFEKIRPLHERFVKLRKKQKPLETEFDAERHVQNQLRSDVRGY